MNGIPNTIVIVYPQIRGMNECARHICFACQDIFRGFSLRLFHYVILRRIVLGIVRMSLPTRMSPQSNGSRVGGRPIVRRTSGRLGRARRCVGAAGRSPRPRSFISAPIGVPSWLSLVSRVSVAGARAAARSEFRTRERSLFWPRSDVDQWCDSFRGEQWHVSRGGPRGREWCVALSVHHDLATFADPRPETGNFGYRSSSIPILSRHACKCTNARSPRVPCYCRYRDRARDSSRDERVSSLRRERRSVVCPPSRRSASALIAV